MIMFYLSGQQQYKYCQQSGEGEHYSALPHARLQTLSKCEVELGVGWRFVVASPAGHWHLSQYTTTSLCQSASSVGRHWLQPQKQTLDFQNYWAHCSSSSLRVYCLFMGSNLQEPIKVEQIYRRPRNQTQVRVWVATSNTVRKMAIFIIKYYYVNILTISKHSLNAMQFQLALSQQ